MPTAKKTASKPNFTAEERAAMRERAKETKKNASKAEDAQAVLDKIAEMPADERKVAERIHAVVTEAAPGLDPKLWYGQQAYAKDGQIVCFYQNPSKFKSRYGTFGFNDPAALDDGNMWPTAFAVVEFTAADEKRLAQLVKKAVS